MRRVAQLLPGGLAAVLLPPLPELEPRCRLPGVSSLGLPRLPRYVQIPRPDTRGGDTLKQVEEDYQSAGRGGLPVKDVGRLLLRCADRPGLVAAVSAFLAGAGANIVSLDQHSTEHSGGTFMQRTIFHLPGLTAARDDLETDFR